jgi:hypothetical protein
MPIRRKITKKKATKKRAVRKVAKRRRGVSPAKISELLTQLTDRQYQDYIDSRTNNTITIAQDYAEWATAIFEKERQRAISKREKFFSLYLNYAVRHYAKKVDARGLAYPIGLGVEVVGIPGKNSSFASVKTPVSVSFAQGYTNTYRAAAQRNAKQIRDGFVSKNSDRISRIVQSKGNLKGAKVLSMNSGADYGGEIRFDFFDGSSFVVRNKTVAKVSQLGKWFYQYPTTFHRVIMPDGTSMKKPSEKRMNEVFAVA